MRSKIVAKPGRAYDALRSATFGTIAAASGVSAPTVSRVLRGEPCQIRTARKLCDMLGCGFADLFELKKEEFEHE